MAAGEQRRRWDWYRLTDGWASRVVADADIRPNDLVLDVGAGNGALTGPLLAAGARVIAVELHPGRRRELEKRYSDAGLRVVAADAGDLRLPRRPFQVVANPPFGVASPLLHRLLAPGSRMTAAHLVLPRSVVARWESGRAPGAGRWRATYHLKAGRRLPRSAFAPAPRVDCRLLVIQRRAQSTRGGRGRWDAR